MLLDDSMARFAYTPVDSKAVKEVAARIRSCVTIDGGDAGRRSAVRSDNRWSPPAQMKAMFSRVTGPVMDRAVPCVRLVAFDIERASSSLGTPICQLEGGILTAVCIASLHLETRQLSFAMHTVEAAHVPPGRKSLALDQAVMQRLAPLAGAMADTGLQWPQAIRQVVHPRGASLAKAALAAIDGLMPVSLISFNGDGCDAEMLVAHALLDAGHAEGAMQVSAYMRGGARRRLCRRR